MWHLWLLFSSIAHAQMTIPGLDSIVAPAAEGAAAGSVVPGIGTIVGGIAGVAGGLLGMVGAQNANTANQEEQVQAEQYNTTMADTAYQRAVADMKAAGINPMLAYMQGGASSPQAPMYTNQNTLDGFASTASDIGDLTKKYLDAQGEVADNKIKQASANVAEPTAQADLGTAQAKQQQNAAAANVATATQQNAIDTSSAQTAKAKADAVTSETDAKWASTHHWMKAVGDGAATAKDITEVLSIPKILKSFKSGNPGGYLKDMGDGSWMNKNTGEIIKQR